MFGRIEVRDDIVFLFDDPVPNREAIVGSLETLSEILRDTGNTRILISGAETAGEVDENAIDGLLDAMEAKLPKETRIAFVHQDKPAVLDLAYAVQTSLVGRGFACRVHSTEQDAVLWLRAKGEAGL